MQRINTPTKAIDLFGPNKHGWTAGNPATNTSATQQSEDWFNAIQEEVCNVIEGAGLSINPTSRTQLREAIVSMITSGGTTGGLKRSFSLTSGAPLREYGNVSAATIGYIAIGTIYNSSLNLATGVWSGRDIAGICWAEKINEAGGVKEYWFAADAAAGVVPSWTLVFSMDTATGTPLSASGSEVATAQFVRAQVGNAGKNADGIRVNRLLPSGTDPYTVSESGEYEFDGTTSPNMPASGLVYVQMTVNRHSTTHLPGQSAGSNVYAVLEIKDFYTNRRWECRATTSAGVVSFTSWSQIGGGSQIGSLPRDVTSSRALNTFYQNTRGVAINVNVSMWAGSVGGGIWGAVVSDGAAEVLVGHSCQPYANNSVQAISFIVPPGLFGKVIQEVGNTQPGLWVETDI